MNPLVYHCVSGHSFFTGVALLMLAAVVSVRPKPAIKRVPTFAFLAGATAVALSSTPIPYWFCVTAGLVTGAWLVSRNKKPWGAQTAYAMVAVWFLAAALEAPYHIGPAIQPAIERKLTVIGDSVTAGVGGDEKSERWPAILARQHDLAVQDISHMGETVASALKRAQDHKIESQVVLLEIGGNDVLGATTVAEFERGLNRLLAHVTEHNRQVIMFELPLPPFFHEYGRVQRTAAWKHGVRLVPKRVFLSVIAGSDSTLDTIHLSQPGHELMASTVWQIVDAAFEPGHQDN